MVLSTITHESWWQQQFGLVQLRDIERGAVYKFKHLQPVDFMTYEFILQLYGDLIDSIEEILAHPVVATPAVMQGRLV
jgi:hypothetical protein